MDAVATKAVGEEATAAAGDEAALAETVVELNKVEVKVKVADDAAIEPPQIQGTMTNSFGKFLVPALAEEVLKTKMTRPLSASSNGSLTADEPPRHRTTNAFVKAISSQRKDF